MLQSTHSLLRSLEVGGLPSPWPLWLPYGGWIKLVLLKTIPSNGDPLRRERRRQSFDLFSDERIRFAIHRGEQQDIREQAPRDALHLDKGRLVKQVSRLLHLANHELAVTDDGDI